MIAYLVNPHKQHIEAVDYDDWRDITGLLRCEIFCVAYKNHETQDVMYVDDVGLLRKDGQAYFTVLKHTNQPLAGYGLLTGSLPDGSSTDVKEPLVDFALTVDWLTSCWQRKSG